MGRRDVLPPEELADQIWGPGFVHLDFEDDPIKYDCVVLGTPGADVMLCDSVWLTEEVGEPGEQEYRLKHFAPGQYTAIFFDWDDVTGRPIFERAVVIRPSNVKPPETKAAPKKPAAKKPAAKKPPLKKPAAKKALPKPTKKDVPKKPSTKKPAAKKATPRGTRKRGETDGK